ncbi:MAG: LL-diaminopimelate aminotransferase [bacterium]|nr:LL-diaminopimelate aminotransferase [bacterium]
MTTKAPRHRLSERLDRLPPYLFAEIDRKKKEVRARGVDLIDLSIGDPDLPTPAPIIEALRRAAGDPRNHQYPSYEGLLSFRRAAADFYRRRFEVELDPETEVLTLIGSKEGIAHFPLAFIDPGAQVLVPDPGYPVYGASTILAAGEPQTFPLRAERGFLPDWKTLKPKKDARILFLNYPNNPTSAVCDQKFLKQAVEFCKANHLILAYDAAYSEMYFGPPPGTALQIPGARDVTIEFHSLSKTFNMTGWRIGFAAGNAELIAGLRKVKTNIDSGAFQAVQEAGIAALSSPPEITEGIRTIYRERRDILARALKQAGLAFELPEATFYLWARVPADQDSAGYTTLLLEKAGVVVTPGSGFGRTGEGYIRFALTKDKDRIAEAARRIAAL